MKNAIGLAAALLLLALPVTEASAQDDDYGKSNWPLSFTKRPIALAGGMLEIRGDTLRANLGSGSALEPVSLAPDVFFGLKPDWTIGVTHDRGICLTGADGGCPSAYDDVGLEVQFRLMGRGSLLVSATGGASVSSLSDPFVAGLDFGFQVKVRSSKFSVFVRPKLYVGLAEREEQGDIVDLPVDLHYQVHTQTAVALETGFTALLDGLGDTYTIPVGLSGLFAVNEKMDFGVALRFPELIGNGEGFDAREIVGRVALRL